MSNVINIEQYDDQILEIEVTSNDRGEKGEKGDTGPQGARGPQGEKGDRGERGLQGEQGERGERGEQGIQGVQGVQGVQGERGEQGARGERGQQGIQGERGEQGEKGDKGDQGERGIQGERGEPSTVKINGVTHSGGDIDLGDNYVQDASYAHANNATITLMQNGTEQGHFTVNQSTDQTIVLAGGGGGGSAVWGGIGGTLSNQVDLQTALDAKQATLTAGSNIDITNNTISATGIPTKTSELTNDSNFPVDANYVHTDNNYTTAEKTKLAGIAEGAEVNVQSDYGQTDTTADDYIKNKPTLGDLAAKDTVGTSDIDDDAITDAKIAVNLGRSIHHKSVIWNLGDSNIASNSDLNNQNFFNVRKYICSTTSVVVTLTNCPTTTAFTMEVENVTSSTIDVVGSAWVYGRRRITDISGNTWEQTFHTDGNATFYIGDWIKTAPCLPLTGGTETGQIISTKSGRDGDDAIWVKHGTSSGAASVRCKRTDSTGDVALQVGSPGVNHGVWSYTLNKWLLYGDTSDVYLADNTVKTAAIKDANVTTAKLADSAVTTAKIADDAITAAKLDTDYLPLTGGTVTGQTIFTQAGMGDSAAIYVKSSTANKDVTVRCDRTDSTGDVSLQVGAGGVNHGVYSNTLSKWMLYGDASDVYLANDTVKTAAIKDLNVTTAKLAASAVTTAKIADLNVTTGKIANGAVTTANIAANAVTPAKILATTATTSNYWRKIQLASKIILWAKDFTTDSYSHSANSWDWRDIDTGLGDVTTSGSTVLGAATGVPGDAALAFEAKLNSSSPYRINVAWKNDLSSALTCAYSFQVFAIEILA